MEILNKIIIDQSQNNLIKCIITDENMEYLNGSDAIKILKKLEKFNKIKYIPIATITAYENVELIDYITKRGADYILSKPCDEMQLKKFFELFEI